MGTLDLSLSLSLHIMRVYIYGNFSFVLSTGAGQACGDPRAHRNSQVPAGSLDHRAEAVHEVARSSAGGSCSALEKPGYRASGNAFTFSCAGRALTFIQAGPKGHFTDFVDFAVFLPILGQSCIFARNKYVNF